MDHGADKQRTIVIVGGGPAGLVAAIAAAERGRRRVVLCEQLDRPGAKLLASGGGRCNLTNTLASDAFMTRFGRQGRFMAAALAALDNAALRELLARLGAPTVVDADGFGVYPASGSAVSVQSALWRRCRELGVGVRLQTRATGLLIEGGELAGVTAESGPLPGERVILATGGRGYPDLGGCGIGYELARQAGHEVVAPTPALVPLVAADDWPRGCAGLSAPNVRIRIALPGQPSAGSAGGLLFTHRGISGPAALDLSGEVASLLAGGLGEVPLRVDLSPGRTRDDWLAEIGRWHHDEGAKMLRTVLGWRLPDRLAGTLLELAGIDRDARCSQVSRSNQARLAGLLVDLPLAIRATEGFRRAMVTRGGVALAGVEPATMQSRRMRGLYLAGELLDLAGPSGGFNLQWAFSSGWLAGSQAAE